MHKPESMSTSSLHPLLSTTIPPNAICMKPQSTRDLATEALGKQPSDQGLIIATDFLETSAADETLPARDREPHRVLQLSSHFNIKNLHPDYCAYGTTIMAANR